MKIAKDKSDLSLTPGFSRVMSAARTREPFQRFLALADETVETVWFTHGRNTPLKRGVNENGAAGISLSIVVSSAI
jgi:hypothetical protein